MMISADGTASSSVSDPPSLSSCWLVVLPIEDSDGANHRRSVTWRNTGGSCLVEIADSLNRVSFQVEWVMGVTRRGYPIGGVASDEDDAIHASSSSQKMSANPNCWQSDSLDA